MFENLTINSNTQSDRILILTEMTWFDYEKLAQDNWEYRISYSSNVITIVSPSRNHERIAQTISILINAYCRKYQIPYFALGAKDIKKQFIAGKQPDASYCFWTEKDPPDLAVEVNYTSGSIFDLEKYKLLNVPEVWIWQDNSTAWLDMRGKPTHPPRSISFYRLKDGEYKRSCTSFNLSSSDTPFNFVLNSGFLNQYIARGLTEDNLTIETEFFNAL